MKWTQCEVNSQLSQRSVDLTFLNYGDNGTYSCCRSWKTFSVVLSCSYEKSCNRWKKVVQTLASWKKTTQLANCTKAGMSVKLSVFRKDTEKVRHNHSKPSWKNTKGGCFRRYSTLRPSHQIKHISLFQLWLNLIHPVLQTVPLMKIRQQSHLVLYLPINLLHTPPAVQDAVIIKILPDLTCQTFWLEFVCHPASPPTNSLVYFFVSCFFLLDQPSDGGCVIDIAHQDWSGLDQYEVRESLFNQDLTCSLLGEQWSVKWHNSLKAGRHAHTHRKSHWDLLCASPVHSLL